MGEPEPAPSVNVEGRRLVHGNVQRTVRRDPRCCVVPVAADAANAKRRVGQRRCRISLISGKIRGKVRKMIGFNRNIII
jgi:hypothetical protein